MNQSHYNSHEDIILRLLRLLRYGVKMKSLDNPKKGFSSDEAKRSIEQQRLQKAEQQKLAEEKQRASVSQQYAALKQTVKQLIARDKDKIVQTGYTGADIIRFGPRDSNFRDKYSIDGWLLEEFEEISDFQTQNYYERQTIRRKLYLSSGGDLLYTRFSQKDEVSDGEETFFTYGEEYFLNLNTDTGIVCTISHKKGHLSSDHENECTVHDMKQGLEKIEALYRDKSAYKNRENKPNSNPSGGNNQNTGCLSVLMLVSSFLVIGVIFLII